LSAGRCRKGETGEGAVDHPRLLLGKQKRALILITEGWSKKGKRRYTT